MNKILKKAEKSWTAAVCSLYYITAMKKGMKYISANTLTCENFKLLTNNIENMPKRPEQLPSTHFTIHLPNDTY